MARTMDAQRALLDQLMGAGRNLTDGEMMEEVDWDQRQYCSFYLSGLCPYNTFSGTKADIGKCTLKHCDKARASFRRAKRYRQRKVDLELVNFLQNLLSDLDRHIRRGHDRIDIVASAPPEKDREEVLNGVKEKIKELHEEMEKLGEAGEVEKSKQLLLDVQKLEARRDRMVHAAENREDHRLLVCDICGGFQVQEDTNKERVEAHETGKQHLGYIKIRSMLKELREKLDKDDFEDRYGADGMVPSSSRHRSDRSRSRRGSSRSRRRSRDRSRSRHRDRDRDRHRSSRYRDDSDDDHHRSSRHRSSRSSRHRSSRYRSRSRSRDRHRSSRHRSSRHRSRSRSRSRRRHRSRSRDRHRSRRSRSGRRSDRRSRSEEGDKSGEDDNSSQENGNASDVNSGSD